MNDVRFPCPKCGASGEYHDSSYDEDGTESMEYRCPKCGHWFWNPKPVERFVSDVEDRLETARAKVEDGRTVLGIADAAWRKDNPPKPDPPDSLGLTQQRRMAWKGGFVYGWIACLAELGVEIKGDDQK